MEADLGNRVRADANEGDRASVESRVPRSGVAAWMLVLLGVVVHLGFLLSLRTGWLNPLFNDALHRFGPGCDFFSIYAAGVKARLGEPVFPIGGHVEQVPYAYAFRYAPVVAYTLGWLLSLFPHITAYGLWLVVCELALLRNLRLSLERTDLAPSRQAAKGTEGSLSQRRKGAKEGEGQAPGPDPFVDVQEFEGERTREAACRCVDPIEQPDRKLNSRIAVAFAMWLCFTPYYLELYVGQFTFVTASLVFWAYLAWERCAGTDLAPSRQAAKEVGGDLFWALAVWLKMMPLIYLPILVLRRRWGAAVGTVAVLVGTSWLYFQRFPADWKLFTATNGDPRPSWHAGNQGLMALLYAASGEKVATYLQLRIGALTLVGLGLAYLFWRACAAVSRPSGSESDGVEAAEPRAGSQYALRHTQHAYLYLYAACSAAYLLCYKDVWEHHYVLLLPPLVLMCLRGVSPWIWAPSYLVAALPWIFPLYDLPGLGYNEDPQRYWTASVSLLHHAFKPVAALWLFGAVLVGAAFQQENTKVRKHEGAGAGLVRRRLAAVATVLLVLVSVLALTRGAAWAGAAIDEQRKVTRRLVWDAELFRLQERREACGPAALAAVCRYYDIPATEAELAKLAGTGPAGTTMLGLREAAEAKGLAAEGRRFTPQTLATAPVPCILYFHRGHFAVLTGVRDGHFYLADPSLGQRVYGARELAYQWRGEALVVGPASH